MLRSKEIAGLLMMSATFMGYIGAAAIIDHDAAMAFLAGMITGIAALGAVTFRIVEKPKGK